MKNDSGISLDLFEILKGYLQRITININKILMMKRTFSRGLNVTGRVKLVPELKTIGLG